MCLLVGPTLSYQFHLFSPWYVLMHKGGYKLNLNLSIARLFFQETYTSTDTNWAGMRVHHTALDLEALWKPSKPNDLVLVNVGALILVWIWELGSCAIQCFTLAESRLDCLQFSI